MEIYSKKNKTVAIKVTNEELEFLRNMNTAFSQAKMKIADLEIEKQATIHQINVIRSQSSMKEREMIKTYGEGMMVDLNTGEINFKQK